MTEVPVKVLKALGYHKIHKPGETIQVKINDVAIMVQKGYAELDGCDYQLKGGKLKVRVIDVGWNVDAIRSDNGQIDSFPITYFNKEFRRIEVEE